MKFSQVRFTGQVGIFFQEYIAEKGRTDIDASFFFVCYHEGKACMIYYDFKERKRWSYDLGLEEKAYCGGADLLSRPDCNAVPVVRPLSGRRRHSGLNTNWGLSFQENGKAPRGNASAEFLAQYHSYYVQQTDKKRSILLSTPVMKNGNTPAILDTLKSTMSRPPFLWWAITLKPARSWSNEW